MPLTCGICRLYSLFTINLHRSAYSTDHPFENFYRLFLVSFHSAVIFLGIKRFLIQHFIAGSPPIDSILFRMDSVGTMLNALEMCRNTPTTYYLYSKAVSLLNIRSLYGSAFCVCVLGLGQAFRRRCGLMSTSKILIILAAYKITDLVRFQPLIL